MRDPSKLTSFSHGAGCACKLGPGQLSELMSGISLPSAPAEVLVAAAEQDDAAVYRLAEDRALVATVDFFTPIVDDPYDWGRIAATNALSDVYAMGAVPAMALNVVAWPIDDLPAEMLARVLQGGADVAVEAGIAIVGGHSITDPEPKYGMCVIGFVDPREMTTNRAARPGDVLYLTKPLGLGLISTAIKRSEASEAQVMAAVEVMTTLNAAAAEAMLAAGVRAATDVTGFGLPGHLGEMLRASGCSATLSASGPELLPGVRDLAQRGIVAGGTRRNHEFVSAFTDWGELSEADQLVLADAQTSGGLLVAAPDERLAEREFAARGVPARRVGLVEDGEPGRISVTGSLG